MARLPDLEVFAREHGLKIGTIADLIEHRSRNETLIERVGRRTLDDRAGRVRLHRLPRPHRRPAPGADARPVDAERRGAGARARAAVGDGPARRGPLRPLVAAAARAGGDAARPARRRGAAQLRRERRGAAVAGAARSATRARPHRGQMDLRTYGIGAQILRELGVRRMKLLGSPRRMPSMAGYGLEVTGFVAADPATDRTARMQDADKGQARRSRRAGPAHRHRAGALQRRHHRAGSRRAASPSCARSASTPSTSRTSRVPGALEVPLALTALADSERLRRADRARLHHPRRDLPLRTGGQRERRRRDARRARPPACRSPTPS